DSNLTDRGRGRLCGARHPTEHAGDRLQHQVRRRVIGPIIEDLAGLGEGQLVYCAVVVSAAGGEGAIDGAELDPGFSSGIATGRASPAAFSIGVSPAMRRIVATAALSSSIVASRSSMASAVTSGCPGTSPAATTLAAASTSAPADLPVIPSSASSRWRN